MIDTGEVPPGERFDLWADATPRVFEPLAVRPRGDTPFEGRVARHPLGPLTLYRLRADPSRVTRTRAMIGASDPEWVQVSLLLAGRCVVEQDGRRSVLSAGDFASWASSRPYAVDAHTQHDLLVTYCPEPLLRASRIGGRTATTISGAQGAGPLLRRYLRTLLADLGPRRLRRPGSPTGSSSSSAPSTTGRPCCRVRPTPCAPSSAATSTSTSATRRSTPSRSPRPTSSRAATSTGSSRTASGPWPRRSATAASSGAGATWRIRRGRATRSSTSRCAGAS